jgi:acyl-CoA thioester hydrolase
MNNEHIYTLRVHTEDTDFAGVVYHSNYLKFLDRARTEWSEEEGIGIAWQRQHQILLPVYSVEMFFLSPARLHEHVEVVSQLIEVRGASLLFAQHLRLQRSPHKMLCKAKVRIACVNHDMRPRPLPEAPLFAAIRRKLT